VLAPEIFTRARHSPSLASAHHKPSRGLPKKFQGRTFKIGFKIPHRSAYNFGSSGHNITKFYQETWFEAGLIKWTLILQGVPPTKFGRAKNVQNPARFLTTFDFDREYLRNASTSQKSE